MGILYLVEVEIRYGRITMTFRRGKNGYRLEGKEYYFFITIHQRTLRMSKTFSAMYFCSRVAPFCWTLSG